MATKPKNQASYDLKAADRKRKLAILTAVDTYTVGHIMGEAAGRGRPSGDVDGAEWEKSTREYLTWMVGTGDYPHLAAIGVVVMRELSHSRYLHTRITGSAAECKRNYAMLRRR